MTVRIAMWSGPRNISTAMMRAWENRRDTAVIDEPFYACFLTATGIVHPMQDEVLAAQSSDWQTVIDQQLSSTLDHGETIQYQKHMTQHMVVDVDQSWFASVRHAFLIRHPADVVASYAAKRGEVTPFDVGFERQRELFEQVLALGVTPPVIESTDVLKNPESTLSALCQALDVPFDSDMLQWPAGRRESDGVWAPHWYQNVEQSTGFAPYVAKTPALSEELEAVVAACMADYQVLNQYRLAI